jgi:opacity protein-like surface antigen
MLSIRAPGVLRYCLLAFGLAAGVSPSAVAQNSEGTYQVRVGAFLDLGGTRLSETNLVDAGGTAHTGKFGVGGSGGFEMLRAGSWTLGVEGDLGVTGGGAPNINGVRFGADFFASLRGRAGFYLRPDWVVYGTGGAAFRGVTVDAGPIGGAKLDKTLTGGIFGGGLEWHQGGTILFAEYLHTSLAGAEFAVAGNTFSVKGQSDTFRLGVKFKLGYDGYYDYVRDDLRK